MRYWKRWGGRELPLRIVAVFRQTDAGIWQRKDGAGWLTVPGESFSREVEESTMVDEISEADALELGALEPDRNSPLALDVPLFRRVRGAK